ncbi:hypothetical protein BGY98DRAFT_974137 [Russula aff. rugulosa BPL654]|nr:hypothetical protein BGY98DRAFT_974137 [Russula aff. rugulosa BPL654]
MMEPTLYLPNTSRASTLLCPHPFSRAGALILHSAGFSACFGSEEGSAPYRAILPLTVAARKPLPIF